MGFAAHGAGASAFEMKMTRPRKASLGRFVLGQPRVGLGIVLPLATAGAAMSPAGATTPLQIWQDVSRVGVQCVVASAQSALRDSTQRMLCEKVRALVSPGAPAPVSIIPIGDPALLAPGTVTLLVHASATPIPEGQLVAFTIRPFRAAAEQTSVLYGAAPRAATIANSGAGSPALDAALEAALSETLPWLGEPHPRRPGAAGS